MYECIKKTKLNRLLSCLNGQNMYTCKHKKLKYVYIIHAFEFFKKSYFGGHLGCNYSLN